MYRWIAGALLLVPPALAQPKDDIIVVPGSARNEASPRPGLGPEPFKIDPALAEAVFRNAFDQLKGFGTSTICIGYAADPQDSSDAQDPAPEIVARLADVVPKVKPYSACTFESPLSGTPMDKATGATALIVTIDAVRCSSETLCDVGAGYHLASLAAAGWTCSVERRDGRWVVTQVTTNWMS